ncbi:MAG: CehA/McbA family metallohydrolase, partial [Firmicutes bacterium]|nr:CehA/McbA family metallohydrolase [Bacillota bacterium]
MEKRFKKICVIFIALLLPITGFLFACSNEGNQFTHKGIWLKGDVHTHSTYSDGSGTVLENFETGKLRGLGFIGLTDHDTAQGFSDAQTIGQDKGITPIWGMEFAQGNKHLLFLSDKPVAYSDFVSADYATAVNSFKARSAGAGGTPLVFVAHPFEYGNNDWNIGDWVSGINGIEVWNAWYGPNHSGNRKARERWDQLNASGHKLYGIATTDTHTADGVGSAYTNVLALDKSATAILNGMGRGNMYGSNGPEIGLRVGSTIMGDSLTLSKSTATVTVNIDAEYIEGLEEITLIHGGINRARTEQTIKIPQNQQNLFRGSVSLTVTRGDFIRI